MRADRVLAADTWEVSTAIDEIVLDFNDRHRRRILLKTASDKNLLLNLPRTTRLRDNDGLETAHGIVRVRAKPERLLAITADPHTILRIAWHLGNRHLPVQILPSELRLHEDHVIADLATNLQAKVLIIEAPSTQNPAPTKATTIDKLFRLLSWLSPAFPTGAYAYSHGIEWAVEARTITDEPSLQAWLASLLTDGTGRNDAILLRLAHRAADDPAPIAELAAATATSAERQLETLAQGSAFRLAIRDWQPQTASVLPPSVAYPVAVGVAAAHAGIDEDTATLAFLQAWCANLVSAGVRLIPLGQSAGLRVLATLEPLTARTVDDTRHATIDSLGNCCFLSDIAAMRHETQYTRLFRS